MSNLYQDHKSRHATLRLAAASGLPIPSHLPSNYVPNTKRSSKSKSSSSKLQATKLQAQQYSTTSHYPIKSSTSTTNPTPSITTTTTTTSTRRNSQLLSAPRRHSQQLTTTPLNTTPNPYDVQSQFNTPNPNNTFNTTTTTTNNTTMNNNKHSNKNKRKKAPIGVDTLHSDLNSTNNNDFTSYHDPYMTPHMNKNDSTHQNDMNYNQRQIKQQKSNDSYYFIDSQQFSQHDNNNNNNNPLLDYSSTLLSSAQKVKLTQQHTHTQHRTHSNVSKISINNKNKKDYKKYSSLTDPTTFSFPSLTTTTSSSSSTTTSTTLNALPLPLPPLLPQSTTTTTTTTTTTNSITNQQQPPIIESGYITPPPKPRILRLPLPPKMNLPPPQPQQPHHPQQQNENGTSQNNIPTKETIVVHNYPLHTTTSTTRTTINNNEQITSSSDNTPISSQQPMFIPTADLYSKNAITDRETGLPTTLWKQYNTLYNKISLLTTDDIDSQQHDTIILPDIPIPLPKPRLPTNIIQQQQQQKQQHELGINNDINNVNNIHNDEIFISKQQSLSPETQLPELDTYQCYTTDPIYSLIPTLQLPKTTNPNNNDNDNTTTPTLTTTLSKPQPQHHYDYFNDPVLPTHSLVPPPPFNPHQSAMHRRLRGEIEIPHIEFKGSSFDPDSDQTKAFKKQQLGHKIKNDDDSSNNNSQNKNGSNQQSTTTLMSSSSSSSSTTTTTNNNNLISKNDSNNNNNHHDIHHNDDTLHPLDTNQYTPTSDHHSLQIAMDYGKLQFQNVTRAIHPTKHPLPPPIPQHSTLIQQKSNDNNNNNINTQVHKIQSERITNENKKNLTLRLKQYLSIFISLSHPLFKERYLNPAYHYFRKDSSLLKYSENWSIRLFTLQEHHIICVEALYHVLLQDGNGLTKDLILQTIEHQFPQGR